MGDENGRIGVFLCDCGGTIDSIDMVELAEYCKSLDGVDHVEVFDFLCSDEMSEGLMRSIQELDLDRIVIGGCSPRIYLEHFQDVAEKAGINRYMVEMANLREQCAWIHTLERDASTEKAKDLLTMSVARAWKMSPSVYGMIASVDKELCDGCGVCKTVCRVEAISIVETNDGNGKIALVDPETCEGCGVCVSSCPSGAMDMDAFSNDEVLAQIDAVTDGTESGFPHILVFACHWCSYAAADVAGIGRRQMDPRFRVIRTLCSARVDPEWVLRAISRGADGVLVMGGKPGHCHYEIGSLRTRKRMTLLTKLLNQLGFDENRFNVAWVDSDEPEEFVRVVSEFVESTVRIGPNPLREQIEAGVTGLRGWWAERAERLVQR